MKSIISQEEGMCFLCEHMLKNYQKHAYLEEHHIFYGSSNRSKSERYGLKINLCMYHHRGDINGRKEAIHFNHDIDIMIKKFAQQIFEKDKTRELFIKEFGKSWL